MNKKNVLNVVVLLGFLASILAGCAPAATPTPETIIQTVEVIVEGTPVIEEKIITATPLPVTEEPAPEKLLVFGAFATPIEEPWDGVIHAALNKAKDAGEIDYEYTENIGYSGDMERILREVADQKQPDIIFGDAFGNEEAVRRVAAEYTEIAFVFGSGLGPSNPNLSVFDNWIHEPACLWNPTTSSAHSSRRSDLELTGPKTRSTRPRKWTPTASRTAGATSTSCASPRGKPRRPTPSGRSPCTTATTSSGQPAQQVYGQPSERAEVQRRRFARPLHPERITRQGQGSQLAASPQGQVHPDDAALLAEGRASVAARRLLEDPRGEAGGIGRVALPRGALESVVGGTRGE